MNGDVWLVLGTCGGGLLLGLLLLGRAFVTLHNRAVAREKAVGHQKIKRAMSARVGRRTFPEVMSHVERAETMRGWVFITMRKDNGYPLEQYVGWAPTRGSARRRLARYLGVARPGLLRGRLSLRNEGGSTDLSDLVLILVGLCILAAVAPHVAHKLLNVGAGLVRDFGHLIQSYL